MTEAFASQVFACLRELGVDPRDDKIDPQQGGTAPPHPIDTSDARLPLTATLAVERSGAKQALVTLGVGGGHGVAVALERV